MEKRPNRQDDFAIRRQKLATLSDEDLKKYFWELAHQTVEPLLDLAKTHTTPAIERSVLLRMGFSSLEAKGLVEKVIVHQLMGKGAGHVVYRYAKLTNLEIRQAGLSLLNDQGWEAVCESFGMKSC
ncbi:MAG: ornithine aminomutase subunit alpha [Bacilli bacterium]|nr:ornithine aminomutase subunit alpha [Bacilli bacterium]